MYAQMPLTLKSQIESLLNTDNFTAAKALYDNWHGVHAPSEDAQSYTDQINKITQRKEVAASTL